MLDNEACIKAYTQTFVWAHGDLLVISLDINASVPIRFVSNSFFRYGVQYEWAYNPYQQNERNITYLLQHAASWVVSGYEGNTYHVQYCFSKPTEERCQVLFSIIIMGIVICCNLAKTLCMLLTLRLQRCQPLVTLGDALESFLRRADPATEAVCLAGKRGFLGKKWENAPMKWKGLRHQ